MDRKITTKEIKQEMKSVGQGLLLTVMYILQICTSLTCEAIISLVEKLNDKIEALEVSKYNSIEGSNTEVEVVDVTNAQEAEETESKEKEDAVVVSEATNLEQKNKTTMSEKIKSFAEYLNKVKKDVCTSIQDKLVGEYNEAKVKMIEPVKGLVESNINSLTKFANKLDKTLNACNAKRQSLEGDKSDEIVTIHSQSSIDKDANSQEKTESNVIASAQGKSIDSATKSDNRGEALANGNDLENRVA